MGCVLLQACDGRERSSPLCFHSKRLLVPLQTPRGVTSVGGVSMTARADVERLIKVHKIHTVKIGIPDMDGIYRGKRMPVSNFLDGLEGGFAQCDVLFGWDIAE